MSEKVKFKDITINLDKQRKPLNGIDRDKISIKKLYPYCGANSIMDYVDEYLFDEEILCIAEDGGKWGKNEKCSYIMNEKCWVNNHAHVVKVKDTIDIRYLKYWLNYTDLNSLITGAIVRKLTQKELNELEILIPVKKEQCIISDKLDEIQSVLDLKEKQIDELNELIKSQFVEMFEDDTYSRVKLGEEFDVSSGGTPSKTKVEYWNSNDISWIGSNMCQNKIIYENDGKYISKSGLEHSSAKVYPVDTVLVALVGATIGKTALLKFETATNQNIAGIQVSERFNAEYVYFAIQNLYYKFTELGKGTFKMANLSFVRDLEIPMPPIELQNKFADFVKQIDKQKFEIQKSLKEMQKLQGSLTNKYFG